MTSVATSLAVTNPWASVPALGNLDSYISAVNRMPMLTQEEEQTFARQYRIDNDLQAAGKLVLSHLRLVVSTARQYLGYGLPHGDLIQEGNIGLMKAVKNFDPEQGVRLVSYALYWIKAEIREYVVRNWRMVKIATTKAHRKLFFNLRSMKQRFHSEDAMSDSDSYRNTLTESQIDAMSKELNVAREDVIEMESRLSGGDVWLDPNPSDNGDETYWPISYLADESHEPGAIIEAHHRDILASDGLAQALNTLDARSRHIIEERWLKVNDDNSGGMTLQDLAGIYGVSAERIRQIEVKAMKKMKESLVEFA